MEIVSNIALISINETMVIQLISFLIFVFIINRVMFRPLQKTMNERDLFMDGIHQDIAVAQQRLDDVMKELKDRESGAQQEAMEVKNEIDAAAEKAAATVLSAAREEVTVLSQRTEVEVNAMLAAAAKNMETEARQLTVFIMEKVLDRRVSV
jgi:F-type H+-transporting ATPase subunit b